MKNLLFLFIFVIIFLNKNNCLKEKILSPNAFKIGSRYVHLPRFRQNLAQKSGGMVEQKDNADEADFQENKEELEDEKRRMENRAVQNVGGVRGEENTTISYEDFLYAKFVHSLRQSIREQKRNENNFEMERKDYVPNSRFAEVDIGASSAAKSKAASKSGSKSTTSAGSGSGPKPEDFEDCVACRMIWGQVEMDVGNARYVEDVQASFEHNCIAAQKAPIFYRACEDMYDDMYAFVDDYMSSKYKVDEMCELGRLCIAK